MRLLILLVSFIVVPISVNAQTVGVILAKDYAKKALKSKWTRNINVEIIDWDYNSYNDRFYVHYRASYETYDVVAWFDNSSVIELKCNLDGTSAKLKHEGAFESWQNIENLNER